MAGQLPPSLAASTIRARSAKPCAVRRRPAKAVSSNRSASVNANACNRALPITTSCKEGHRDTPNGRVQVIYQANL